MTSAQDVIRAAASVGRDVAEGRLDPDELDQAVVSECRELFGTVGGDGDPLWTLHRDVARQSIALGALSADELAEWVAVIRRREGVGSGAVTATDAPSSSGVDDAPPEPNSVLSVAHSPAIDELAAEDSD